MRGNLTNRGFHFRRRARLTDRGSRTSGIQNADGFVRQLAAGNVAIRKNNRVMNRFIENAYAVMFFSSDGNDTSQHGYCYSFWLVPRPRNHLKAARRVRDLFRNISYIPDQVVAAIVRSSPRASAGFQHVCRITLPRCCAGTNQSVCFVNKKDDWSLERFTSAMTDFKRFYKLSLARLHRPAEAQGPACEPLSFAVEAEHRLSQHASRSASKQWQSSRRRDRP